MLSYCRRWGWMGPDPLCIAEARRLTPVFGVETMLRPTPGWEAKKTGAACVTRTRDPRITNAVLYRLS